METGKIKGWYPMRWGILIYFLLPAVVWSVYWFAFYPAIMTPDSLWQWKQMETLELNAQHSPVHTLTIRLVTLIWADPAAMALFQIVLLSLISAWGLVVLRNARVPRGVVLAALLLYCLHPANGYMAVTLIKDVFYAAALLLLTVFLCRGLLEPAWLESGKRWIGLGLLLAAPPLFRHNGLLVTILICPWMLWVFRPRRACLRRAIFLALVLLLLVKFGLFPVLGVTPNYVAHLTLIHQMAAFIHHGADFTVEEKELLNSFRPLRDRWNYNCHTVTTTQFREGTLDYRKLYENRRKFMAIWWKTALKHPDILWRHQRCVTGFLWNIKPPPIRHLITVHPGIFDNELGLKTRSILPSFRERLIFWTKLSQRGSWFLLLWWPPVYLYAVLLALVLLCFRAGSGRWLIVGAPVLLNTLSLLVSAPGYVLRFQYPLFLAAPFLLALLFLNRSSLSPPSREEEGVES